MKRSCSILPVALVVCVFAALSARAGMDSRIVKFVEYIESDTNRAAYINTEYVPNEDTEIEMAFSFTTNLEVKTYAFGTYGDDSVGRFQFSYGPDATGCFFGYGRNYTNSYAGLTYDTSRHVVKYVLGEGRGFYFDGNLVDPPRTDLTKWEGPSTNLYLGACNPRGRRWDFNTALIAPIRIYSCKIWENGALVRDFWPVLVNGRSAGLYDAVQQKRYYNANTNGTFIASENEVEVPTDYRKAIYIETTNCTAYIDTEYEPKANTELELLFSFTTVLTNRTYVFGEYGNAGRLQFAYGPENCLFGFGGQDNYDGAITGFAYNTERHIVKYVTNDGFYFDGTKVVAKDGVDLKTWGGTSKSLYLGTLNRNDNGINVDLNSPIRIYRCKIWEGNELKRDLVPRQRVFDNKNGLYDNVTGKFYCYYGDGEDFTALLARTGLVVVIR